MRVKLNGRDEFENIKIHPHNQNCSSLDDVAAPLLKNFFLKVNKVTLGDRVAHDFSDAEYDEDCDVERAELNCDPRRVDVNFDDIFD